MRRLAQRFVADVPGDPGGEHQAGGGTEADQPALPSRLCAVHRARRFAEHAAVQPPRRLDARQAPVQRAQLAAVVGEQPLELVVGPARRVHVANLARMRASA